MLRVFVGLFKILDVDCDFFFAFKVFTQNGNVKSSRLM